MISFVDQDRPERPENGSFFECPPVPYFELHPNLYLNEAVAQVRDFIEEAASCANLPGHARLGRPSWVVASNSHARAKKLRDAMHDEGGGLIVHTSNEIPRPWMLVLAEEANPEEMRIVKYKTFPVAKDKFFIPPRHANLANEFVFPAANGLYDGLLSISKFYPHALDLHGINSFPELKRQKWSLFLQGLSGLQALHDANFVHGDCNNKNTLLHSTAPQNMNWWRERFVSAIARLADFESVMPQCAVRPYEQYTPEYAPWTYFDPELENPKLRYIPSFSEDVFSVGISFLRLNPGLGHITNYHPLVLGHATYRNYFDRLLPTQSVNIVFKALAKDPNDRPTLRELREILGNTLL